MRGIDRAGGAGAGSGWGRAPRRTRASALIFADMTKEDKASSESLRLILVVFLGGCTFSEISALRFLGREKGKREQKVGCGGQGAVLRKAPRLAPAPHRSPVWLWADSRRPFHRVLQVVVCGTGAPMRLCLIQPGPWTRGLDVAGAGGPRPALSHGRRCF